MTKNKKSNNNSQKEPQLIVAIGASAGGLEAFSQLLKALPDDTGMSFIFVQHLEPSHKSKLTEILSNVTSMQVNQVNQNMEIKPDNLYIIPPNKYLSIRNQKLILSKRTKSDGLFLPVDYLFNSLAKEKKNKAIGIILSGTASDGTEGLKAIKAEGGLTFAQDRASANYDGMPASAADSGNVDIILPPDKIANELVRIAKFPLIAFPQAQKEEKNIKNDDAFFIIFRLLRKETGVDFSFYKSTTIKRRITRRMVINKIHIIDEYVRLLKRNEDEVKKLYRDLLINVTSFFRDPEVFDVLKKKIYPELLKGNKHNNPIRIWIPGCATGEEVYSIAISLMEFLSKKKDVNFQIFATDISDTSLEKARSGLYPESSIKNIPPELLKKYFYKTNGNYQVNKNIRDVCIFARQNISKDPPFSKIDLISCRNLLIYLSAELQKMIMPVFHYALKPKGFLLLGTSESIGTFTNLFELVDKKYKIYRKKYGETHFDYRFSFSDTSYEKSKNKNSKQLTFTPDIQKEADKILLNNYAPAGILVNNDLDIISFRGKVNQYLDPSSGDASLNLFKMIKPELNVELHSAFRKINKSSHKVVVEDIKLDLDGTKKTIDLEVLPVKISYDSNDIYYMIIFKEKGILSENEIKKKPRTKKLSKTELESEKYTNLKEELIITKEHLQSIIEEREAANEELRATMEELQSSNEELQSTNEEMETGREELQSTNEELITVNDELENRNIALSEVNDDLMNLLSSINQPIIMLDRDLRIKRFTAKAETEWNLIPGDIGRPIGNLKPNFEIPDLKEKILEVMNDLNSKEFKIKDNKNKWYSVKITPYITAESKIDGVVISWYDINTLKEDIETAVESSDFFEAVINTTREALIVLNGNLQVISVNKSFLNSFKLKEKDTIGSYIYDLNKGKWDIPSLKKLLEEIIPENSKFDNYELPYKFNRTNKKKLLLNARMIEGKNGREKLILLAIDK